MRPTSLGLRRIAASQYLTAALPSPSLCLSVEGCSGADLRGFLVERGIFFANLSCQSDGHFQYFLDEEKMNAELLREGRYIVTTNDPHISPREAVAHYKELSDIEAGFREFKDIIQGRPIYHQREDRICAHLFIAQLALLVFRQLRFHLDRKNVLLSPSLDYS
jgi:hypothetical protein